MHILLIQEREQRIFLIQSLIIFLLYELISLEG